MGRALAVAWVALLLVRPGPASGQLALQPRTPPMNEYGHGSMVECLTRHWPFHQGDPDAPDRYVGWGDPLQGTSWRNRPFHTGWAVGVLFGDALIGGRVDQGERVFGAYRIGWDFDHYWGTEFRSAFAQLEVIDRRSQQAPRNSRNLYWDAHLLYYPWGDARWRPYASLGMGLASFRFQDDLGQNYNEVLFGMPFGLGVKYQARKWLAFRLDLTDNLAISAAGLSTMHNVSLTGGVEIHCGGRPTLYYPWSPGLHPR